MQNFLNTYYRIIADNMKKIRLSNNLSQESFAEKLGCSREYVSRLENYKEKISQNMLLKISYVMKIKPEEFYKV